MSRTFAIPTLVALLGLGASGVSLAEDWRFCAANSGITEGDRKEIHWALSQPFEVTNIPDWQAQFEAVKPERKALAAQRGLEAPDDSFACSRAFPDLASVQADREDARRNFFERKEYGEKMGIAFEWEDWDWLPTGASATPREQAVAGTTEADPEANAGDGDVDVESRAAEAKAAAEVKATAEAKAAAAAKAERDRLAAENARLQREIAQAKAERDRLAMATQKASTDTDAKRCVTSPELRQNDTFQGNTAAYVTNGCATPVDVRICLMKENKVWNCGMTNGLQPQHGWSWSSMKATGEVFMDARVTGSTRPMGAPR